MGKVVERKKKKKGRPSLLDLQKRTLKEEQQQQQQQQKQHQNKRNISAHHSPNNYHSATPLLLRRSTRRNPNPSEEEPEDDEESSGRRREKKLKLVLKLPSEKSPNTLAASLNSSDSNADSSSNQRKRKINAIADGSEAANSAKGEKPVFGTNPTNNARGTQLDSGPSTPLPDKKLLLFILDRLQKKDTYGVFSEPVDPNELPDYHEVIEHPMDFGTVRNKLASGTYANLEQFERDVYLICSNAMQYNAPDTIYFRQARSIQELAKKNFENLRQDSDDNEPEPKVIRRGRPPSRNLKKQLGRHLQERAGSEFSSDAALANGIENTIWPHHDPKRGPLSSDKTGFSDSSGRLLPRDVYSSWLAENKLERSDEGSILKGYSMKHAKRQFVLDGNRRNTYKQYHPSAGGQEPSVLTTFDGERKQLMTVGLLTEHGYARSLARFAANLGPVAWNVAARKMEKCLPPGIKFGPGWVGENDLFPQKPLPSLPHPAQLSSSQKFSVAETSCCAASPCTLESRGDKVLEKSEGVNSGEKHVPLLHSAMDGYLSKPLTPSAITSSSSLFPARGSPEPCTEVETTTGGLNSHSGLNMLNSNVGIVRPRPPFQIHPGMNGFNGTYGISIPAQMGKLMGTTKSGGFSFQHCQVVDTPSRTNNNSVHPGAMNNLNLEDSKLSENPSTITSSGPLTNSECEASAASKSGLHPQPAWEVLSSQLPPDCRLLPELKPDSVPPDLNVRFQSPGSPSSSRVDSTQPHLALQL